eukprot:scaffold4727_cov36-Prasinocladus_malaysianus.AAC.2
MSLALRGESNSCSCKYSIFTLIYSWSNGEDESDPYTFKGRLPSLLASSHAELGKIMEGILSFQMPKAH